MLLFLLLTPVNCQTNLEKKIIYSTRRTTCFPMCILIAFAFCLIGMRSAHWKSWYGTDYYLECSFPIEVVITTSQHNLYQQLQPCRSHGSDVMSLVTSKCHCEPGCSTRPVCFLTIALTPWGIQRQTAAFLFFSTDTPRVCYLLSLEESTQVSASNLSLYQFGDQKR